ncbi:unnamed protein product, partial [Allacma fusca]
MDTSNWMVSSSTICLVVVVLCLLVISGIIMAYVLIHGYKNKNPK